MKRYQQWPLFLSALLLTVLGAAMPRAVSAIQDRAVAGETESRSFAPVDLRLMQGVGVQKALGLAGGPMEEMDWPGKTRLTKKDAGEAVKDTLTQLYQSGLIDSLPENLAACDTYAHPRLFMSTDDSSVSAVVWCCSLGNWPDSWFYIDDETGKMVWAVMSGMSALVRYAAGGEQEAAINASDLEDAVSVSAFEDAVAVSDFENSVRQLERWRLFLSDYYGMELEFTDVGEFDSGFGVYAWMSFDAGDDTGQVYLELQEWDIFWN